jgi:serine O-acetyltransferase
MFELIREDWRTHDGDIWRQGIWVLVVYRFGRWRYKVPGIWRKPLSFVYKLLKIWSQIMTGIDIPCEATIGRRLTIEHFGGIVVSGDAVLGDDVVIRNGVTIGLKRTGEAGAPQIGNRVDIGSGAKILGNIRIGDGAVIGANAVVLQDVPPGALAVGIPARIILRSTTPTTPSEAKAQN